LGQVCQKLRGLEHRLISAKRAFESGRAAFQGLKVEIFELLAYFLECRDAIPEGEEVDPSPKIQHMLDCMNDIAARD
jgi:hypothetical protein